MKMKLLNKNKYDTIIIIVILLASLFSWLSYQVFFADQSPKAEIYYYSKLVKTVDLGQGTEQWFSIEQKPNVVFHLFEDGSICFEESNCPHKLCIQPGKLNKPGQFAACLPNGLVLKIIPAKDNNKDADIVIGY
jgi:hypothetical protein